MALKILAILNLIITVQALFLCLHFIFKSKGQRILNRLLAFLCFSFAVISLNTYFNVAGIFLQDTLLQDISNNLMWFIGPTLYMYVIYNDKKPERRFIYFNTFPFLFLALINILFDWKWFSIAVPFIGFTQMSIYLFLSLKYCYENYSNAKRYYNWILPSIIVFAVLIVVNFSLHVLESMGIKILSDAVLQSFTSLLVIPIFYLAYKEMNSAGELGITPKKYHGSQISEEKTNQYLAKIEAAMEEDKLYLQEDLTLQKLSRSLDISPKFVSQVINQKLEMSFSEYIFRFRLDEVKKRLTDSRNKNKTIFGIAQESGFKSNSRFNYLFKKHTGQTPKEFQKLHIQ